MAINFYSDIHLNANKLGRDADNLLDFSTDNEITFRVGAGDGVVFKASGEIEATKFDGALEGNADTATVATTVTATINESASENNVITFLANGEAETGNHELEFDDSLTYNPSNGTVTSARFSGNLVGNADTATSAATLTTARTIGGVSFNGSANITLPGVNAEGNQNTTGNAATATGATTIIVNDNESTAEENQITFIADAAGGSVSTHRYLEADGDLTYNPSTGTLTATNFSGKVKMNVSSTTDGNVGSGDVVYFGSGTVVTGKIYHYKSDGSWELSDPNSAVAADGLLGVALDDGTASDVGMLLRGMVTLIDIVGTEAVGDVLYLSADTTGAAASAAPSGSGDIVRIIGYCLSTDDQIWFNPSPDYITLA